MAVDKPYWKRRRWIVIAALWLVLAYTASVGPVAYERQRGWLPPETDAIVNLIYAPLTFVVSHDFPLSGWLMKYSLWWQELGRRHALEVQVTESQ